MYRHLLPLLLCQAAVPAPQSIADSDITYVKIQPPIEAPSAPSHYRESRIENLPLTIPGNVTSDGNQSDKEEHNRYTASVSEHDIAGPSLRESTVENSPENVSVEGNQNIKEEFNRNTAGLSKQDVDSDITLPESSNLSELTALPDVTDEKETEIDLPENTSVPEIVADVTALPESIEPTGEELLEAHGSISDTIPSETYQSERRGRIYDSLETTDIFEDITEKYAAEPVTRTKPTPNFPKLSYFQKPQGFVSFPTNSLEKSAKRRFRSHCRCEKIWNCPKLQISVHRCPNEYFLCCF